MLLGLEFRRLQVSPRTSQAPHRLLIRSRYPRQGELTRVVQACRADRVAMVRHWPIPGPALRDQDVAAVRFVSMPIDTRRSAKVPGSRPASGDAPPSLCIIRRRTTLALARFTPGSPFR